MRNYYFTTPVVRTKINTVFLDAKEAKSTAISEIKRLNKENVNKKILYGYEIFDEKCCTQMTITSCKVLSKAHTLQEIDGFSMNPENEKFFEDKNYVVSHKAKNTIISYPVLFEEDKKSITPIYIEKALNELVMEGDLSFIYEVIRRYKNYPFLTKSIEVLENAVIKHTENNSMKMSIMEAIFNIYYTLICHNADTSYVNGQGVEINYNYNSMRKIGLFIRDYKIKKDNRLSKSETKVTPEEFDSSNCLQLKIPGF